MCVRVLERRELQKKDNFGELWLVHSGIQKDVISACVCRNHRRSEKATHKRFRKNSSRHPNRVKSSTHSLRRTVRPHNSKGAHPGHLEGCCFCNEEKWAQYYSGLSQQILKAISERVKWFTRKLVHLKRRRSKKDLRIQKYPPAKKGKIHLYDIKCNPLSRGDSIN